MKILKRTSFTRQSPFVSPKLSKLNWISFANAAVAAGFDLGATMRESLASTVRQIRSEMDALEADFSS